VKSNGNLTILKNLAKLGSGFDVVSGGELDYLARLGVPGSKIVFSGVGKSREEIRGPLITGRSGSSDAASAFQHRIGSRTRCFARRPQNKCSAALEPPAFPFA
jgi:hypothetical protein